jgi:hypothetical protein
MNRLAIFIILIVMLSGGPAPATVIHVPSQYSTIQEGIDAGSDGDTVLVQPDTYGENINFNGHNILLCSMFLPTGNPSYIFSTIIDGGSSGSVATFSNSEDSTARLIGFTIQNGYAEQGGGILCVYANPVVSYNIIDGNTTFGSSEGEGGGIYCSSSDIIIANNIISANMTSGPLGGKGGGIYCQYGNPKIYNNIIRENFADWGGGGIWCDSSNPVINQNIFKENTGNFFGGAISCDDSNPIIMNTVFYGNMSPWMFGSALFFINNSAMIITNSIFWNHDEPAFYYENSTYEFTYTDFQDLPLPGVGNITDDPLFRDPQNDDFHLMATYCGDPYDSPCIDAGDPDVFDSLLDCAWGLGTASSDMGAYGGGDSTMVGIPDEKVTIPSEYRLYQNYPNPFNSATTITYALPENAHVRLEIYNLLGQGTEVLVDSDQRPGEYAVTWNSTGFASGIYFCKLTAGDKTFTRRMTLLK